MSYASQAMSRLDVPLTGVNATLNSALDDDIIRRIQQQHSRRIDTCAYGV